MSGPQEERLSKWSKEADLGYPEQRETIRGPQLAGKEKRHQDSLNQYRAQVEHLKQLVQRQEVVINNYQIKYPTVTPPSDTTVDEALDAELPPWVADPQHLSPLLSAYDERMRELEDENTKLKDQALSFKGRADELVKENERVRKDLQHYIEKMLKHAEGPEGGIDVGNAMGGGQGADSEALTDLTEMADVLNKTNSIMTEQIAMLETELGKTKASEQTASERLEKVSKTASEQALSLTQLSQLNKTLENERDDTARRMKDIVAELSNAHTAKERLEVEKKHANDGLRKKEKEVRDLKDALSDIGRAANTERESLEDRMNSVIEDANHLRQQLRSTEAELDAAREQLRRISLEFETTRADAEGMLKVMNGMEEQLTEYASREEQTVTLVKESKERVETALLERDQAVAREVQSRQEIARLLEKRREYAKELMAAEEKVAKETRDRMMEQLKARDEELNQLSERCAILQTDMARKDREAKAAQAERMSLLGEVNEERQRLRDSIDAFAAKSLERTTRQNEAEEKAAAAQSMLAEKEQAMALSLADVAEKLYVVHRRPKFRAAPESCAQLDALAAAGKVEMVIPYQLHGLRGEGSQLKGVEVATLKGETRMLDADVLLPFFGLAMELGPIADWGLGLEKGHITVDSGTLETSADGIFAIGDIATYPHKLKLILCGFSEAAMACHAIYPRVHPGEVLHFEYSTTKGVP